MAPTRRVNTTASPHLIRAAFLILAAAPAGVVAARLARGEASETEAWSRPSATAMTIAVMSVAFAWTAIRGPTTWPLLAASLGLAGSLVCLAAIDLAVYRLPDFLTLPLLAAGLIVSVLLPGRPVMDHAIGAIAGWGVLAWLAWAFRRWRGVEGMGLGDAKLFGAAGAWLGWEALPSVMLIACAAAFLWVGLKVVRRGFAAAHERIAFGAPLCLAILAVWLEGPLVV
jgi:leader peptidase (prepilin peptidase)/N-methyltransferase